MSSLFFIVYCFPLHLFLQALSPVPALILVLSVAGVQGPAVWKDIAIMFFGMSQLDPPDVQGMIEESLPAQTSSQLTSRAS